MEKSRKIIIAAALGILIIGGLGFLFRGTLKVLAMEVVYFSRGDIPEITVDFNDVTGDMKALHGINNGPKSGYTGEEEDSGVWRLDMTKLYQELHIPMVRTHDAEYPYGQDKFVDIHCIFPDMSRDPEDPSAYHFEETDEYLAAIVESGAQIFFRLGESIDHSGENKYINPPEDYTKWAQVCEHIIRHYNEGWADGFHYGIVYWEIWNEPENVTMWTGSMEQFYELYRTTARYLKQIYPELKIGGCAMGSVEEEPVVQFLQSLKADGKDTPLDFFSWHTYTADPDSYAERAAFIRELLDENGYEDTESILDEWNYIESWNDLEQAAQMIHSPAGAAFIAAGLIGIQKSPVDLAMYYDGQHALADLWCGLYDSEGRTEPGYYAFSFYDRLYRLGSQVRMDEGIDYFYCCAATGEKDGILLTNFNPAEDASSVTIRLKINGGGKRAAITRINDRCVDGVTTEERWFFNHAVLEIQAGEVVYIELS